MTMQNPYKENGNNLIRKIWKKPDEILEQIYEIILRNITLIIIFCLLISVGFSVFKTLFVEGYPVDSYQFLAASYEKWIKTGVKGDLIDQHSASQRIIFPLIIAITHILIPIDISLLACILNLVAAISSILILRRILELNNFSQEETDLSTLFIILSYNFLNYWFTILTDVASLPFFLLMIYSLELFLKKRPSKISIRIFLISISIFSFLLAFLTREIYVFSIALYFVVIKKRRIRFITFLILSWFLFLLVDLDPTKFTFVEHVFSRAAWEEFKLRNYIEVFVLLQGKWSISNYFEGFIKGLFKVGIIPAILIITLIFLLSFDWGDVKKYIKKEKTLMYSSITKMLLGNIPLLIIWFILYFLVYSFFYYNVSFPTGLRYWLPISWILLAYLSKLITQKVKNHHLKLLIILFLCFYPIAWSSVELYENRNVQTGTGPIFSLNEYFNNMTDLRSITKYDSRYITINLKNGSFFETTSTTAAYENETIEGHKFSKFSFFIWENASINLTIEVRLYTPNNAYWGFEIYEVTSNFAPGHGKVRFAKQRIEGLSYFQTFKYTTNQSFLARWVTLNIGGGKNSTIIWDYLRIIVH